MNNFETLKNESPTETEAILKIHMKENLRMKIFRTTVWADFFWMTGFHCIIVIFSV